VHIGPRWMCTALGFVNITLLLGQHKVGEKILENEAYASGAGGSLDAMEVPLLLARPPQTLFSALAFARMLGVGSLVADCVGVCQPRECGPQTCRH
jgi:hypothetical protein